MLAYGHQKLCPNTSKINPVFYSGVLKVFFTFLVAVHEGSCLTQVYFKQPQSSQHVFSNPNSAILVITQPMVVVYASIGVNQPLCTAFFFTERQSTPLQWTGLERQNPSFCLAEYYRQEIFTEYKTDLYSFGRSFFFSSFRVLLLIMNGSDMLL